MKNQNIEIHITGDASSFQKAVSDTVGKINKLETVSRGATSSMTSSFSTLGKTVVGFFAARQMASYAASITRVADQYSNINARLNLVSETTEDLLQIQDRLYQSSQETGTSYSSNADAYAKLAMSLKGLKAKSEELLRINDLVSKSLIINGSSAEESASFQLQFAQAMGSGVLQGDEFKAMLESNSYFASLLAKALGTDIAGLRKMSKEGKLTTAVLREAFPKMAEEINAAFSKIPPTTQRALAALQNAFYRIIDDSNKASGGTGKISAEILNLAATIDQNREGIVSLFSAIIAGSAEAAKVLGYVGGRIGEMRQAHEKSVGIIEYMLGDPQRIEQIVKYGREAVERQSVSFNENAATGAASYRQIADAAKSSADKQKNDYIKVTKEIEDKYRSMADRVKSLFDELAGEQQGLQSQLREMGRANMDGISAWNDLKAEADEYYLAAEKAATGGNLEEAKKLADEARQRYAELNRAVEENGRILITQSEAEKAAVSGVRESAELKIKFINQQIEAEKKAADSLNKSTGGELAKNLPEIAKQFGDIKGGADDLAAASAKFNEDWNKAWSIFLEDGKKSIGELDGELSQLTKDRHIKVYVEEVKSTSGTVERFASGGVHSGGFRIVGERGPELEYTGPSRIFNATTTGSILSRLSNLIDGPGGQFAEAGSVVNNNVTVHYTGTGSQTDANNLAKRVLTELERMNRRSSS